MFPRSTCPLLFWRFCNFVETLPLFSFTFTFPLVSAFSSFGLDTLLGSLAVFFFCHLSILLSVNLCGMTCSSVSNTVHDVFFFSHKRTLRVFCSSVARIPTLFRSVSVCPALVAVTVKSVKFHRRRCTDGFLRMLNRFNLPSQIRPVVVFGGTQHKVFPHAALAHSSNDTTNFQRVTDRGSGLHRTRSFSRKVLMASGRSPPNGVPKISSSFTTTLALLVGSYLLTCARQASNHSPSLLVRTIFHAWKKSAATLFSSALVQSSSRRSNSVTVASSSSRASTARMTSCTRPRWHRPAQVRNTRDQSRHPVSSPLKLSCWYLAANAPNPNRPSSAPCAGHLCPAGPTLTSWRRNCHTRFLSVHSFLQHLPSFLVGFQKLSRWLCSFLALSHSFVHFHHLLDQRCNLLFHNSGLTT